MPRLACTRLQERHDLGLGRHVERGRGLVGDEQLRVAGERRGERDALAHAARELERHSGRRHPRRRCRPRRAAASPRARARRGREFAAGRRSISSMCAPQRSSGFSIVNGSCRMQRARGCRAARASSRSGRAEQVAPSKRDLALRRRRPAAAGRAIARAVSDLPRPDSPTIADRLAAADVEIECRRRWRGVRAPDRRAGSSRPRTLEERRAVTASCPRSDRRSYSQSPMRFMLTAVSTIIAAGREQPPRGWRRGCCGSRTASGPSRACRARRRGRGTRGRRALTSAKAKSRNDIREHERQHVRPDVDEDDARLARCRAYAPPRYRAAAAARGRAPRTMRVSGGVKRTTSTATAVQ